MPTGSINSVRWISPDARRRGLRPPIYSWRELAQIVDLRFSLFSSLVKPTRVALHARGKVFAEARRWPYAAELDLILESAALALASPRS